MISIAISPVLVGAELVTQTSDSSKAEAVAQHLTPLDQNSHDLFEYQTDYTFKSDFKDDRGKLGEGDSLYNDFSYDHRFLINGNWYFRTGIEYERFDFGGTDNGLPDHLQSLYGHVAVEYVVKDVAAAEIELDPGTYFQDKITGDSFDIPWKMFVTFPLKKDTIYGVVGLGGGIYQHPVVAPGGGILWLITDKIRLEGVFPKPALVYQPNEDWQFRIQGNLYYESFRTDDVFTTEKKIQLHNAVVQYNEDRVGLQVRYRGINHVELFGDAGCTVFREFDFFRADRRVKLDPAPYVQGGIKIRF
ncbi:MAG TPA: hypothetical protein VJ721_04900 [Chthoniobacterales bacterium]|nr:hypothetical protein [Chthoniobacterales bacterium]